MTKLTRDLITAGEITVFIVVSLLVVRLTASGTDTTTPATQVTAEPTAIATFTQDPRSTTPPSVFEPAVASSPITAAAPAPAGVMVISSGIPVVPRADPTLRTFRPAPPVPQDAPVTMPVDTPTAETLHDPAVLAIAWLNALCWYNFHEDRSANTRRAARYGTTVMPSGQDPFTLDDDAWTEVTDRHLSSACTGITATIEPISHGPNPSQLTARIVGTQILSAKGLPFQATPVSLTRGIAQGPGGQWSIGAPITAN